MRVLVQLVLLFAAAAPMTAQQLSLCAGNNYVAHATWTQEGESRVAIVDLAPPLTERSERTLPEVTGVPRLYCEASRLIVDADERLAVTPLGSGEVRIENLGRDEPTPETHRPLEVGCSAIGEAAVEGDGQMIGHGLGLWTDVRRTEDGDQRYMVIVSVEGDSEGGHRVITVLEERLSKRVRRELVLGEIACPAPSSDESAVSLEARPFFFALSVDDAERSAEWYERVFGFETVRAMDVEARGLRIRLLAGEGAFLELTEIAAARRAVEVDAELLKRHMLHGVFKVGFEVADLEETIARLEALAVDLRGQVVTESDGSMRSAQVEDPDGNVIQLFEILKTS